MVNAPQANAISAAEHTLALLLSQARHIPQADARTLQGFGTARHSKELSCTERPWE